MGQGSKIEWTHHTFNPWRGCTKVSAGCANCYAEQMSGRNPKTLGVWGPKGARVVAAESYWGLPLTWDKWAAAGICWQCGGKSLKPTDGRCDICDGTGKLNGAYRARVFCASLADVFEGPDTMPAASVPLVYFARRRLFKLIQRTPHLDWLLLTKRPENVLPLTRIAIETGDDPEFDYNAAGDPNGLNAAPFGELFPNVWLGTSIEDQKAADERHEHLIKCQAAVSFYSAEPLIGRIERLPLTGIDWVIVGGESGGGARPMHPKWAREIRDACVSNGAAFHFKQWGEWKPISEMPESEYSPLYKPNRIAEPGQRQGDIDEVYGKRCTVETRAIGLGGGDDYQAVDGIPSYLTFRVGKKAAGRLLDGRTWDEFPKRAITAQT